MEVGDAQSTAEQIERLRTHHSAELPLPDEEHAVRCARFAAGLFDQLASILELGQRDRMLSMAAALWHDVGYARDARDHARKSYDMIVAARLPEFDDVEKSIVACVARYHRRLLPSIEHAGFGQMLSDEQRRVRRLSAIVRIAVALDAGHLGLITSAEVTSTRPNVHLRAVAKDHAEVERDRLLENGSAFRQLTQLPFTFEIVLERGNEE